GTDEAGRPGAVAQRLLDVLDRDRNVLEIERARFLAGRGTDAPRPFREIIGGMQVPDRLVPVALVDEVVPVRNLVVDRTTGRPVTIGHPAIHAARGLLGDLRLRHRQHELAKMPDPVGGRLILRLLTLDLEKSGYLTHVLPISARNR